MLGEPDREGAAQRRGPRAGAMRLPPSPPPAARPGIGARERARLRPDGADAVEEDEADRPGEEGAADRLETDAWEPPAGPSVSPPLSADGPSVCWGEASPALVPWAP